MKRLVILLASMLLFTSCNFLPDTEGGELLKAPMLNQMQKAIYDELNRTIDTKNIVYKYPQHQGERSPFVFYDMNNDGTEEVIVFYSYKDKADEIFAKVMVQDGLDGWKLFFDIPSRGSAVDFIKFAPLFGENRSLLIIGWTNNNNRYLSCYSMTETEMVEELYKPYSDYIIEDIDNNGVSELVLIQNISGQFSAAYYGSVNNRLTEIDRIPLYEETNGIEKATLGYVQGYEKAIYIDEKMSGASVSYSTEIIGIEQDKFVILAGSTEGKAPQETNSQWEAFSKTFRTEKTLSIDLGNDGVVEVPRVRELSDYLDIDNSSGVSQPKLIEYMQFLEGSFEVKFTTAHNLDFGYLIYFPEQWIDNVVIVEQPQRQEWRFYRVNPINGEPTTELLRIRVFYSSDYIDEIAKDDFLLNTKGLFSYYGYIPDTVNEPLAVTKEDVKALFALT